jgi:hypothetical protein
MRLLACSFTASAGFVHRSPVCARSSIPEAATLSWRPAFPCLHVRRRRVTSAGTFAIAAFMLLGAKIGARKRSAIRRQAQRRRASDS